MAELMFKSVTGAAGIAICSVIDGNLTAVEAVLKDIEARKIDRIVVLGDICGVGARNDECISLIRSKRAVISLAGRWDHHFSGTATLGASDPDLEWFLAWSKNRISLSNILWLADLPTQVVRDGWCGVSGRFDEGGHHQYVERVADARKSFDGLYATGRTLGFVGLTGTPVAFFDDDPITFAQEAAYQIAGETKAIFNVGSVGGPKDEMTDSRYVIYDGASVRTVNVRYDIEAELKVRDALGFPAGLQDRLRNGR